MDQYEHGNLCLYLLQQQEEGGFTLLKENDQTHLKDLKQI
jgi:probable phosphoglycerate mutase